MNRSGRFPTLNRSGRSRPGVSWPLVLAASAVFWTLALGLGLTSLDHLDGGGDSAASAGAGWMDGTAPTPWGKTAW